MAEVTNRECAAAVRSVMPDMAKKLLRCNEVGREPHFVFAFSSGSKDEHHFADETRFMSCARCLLAGLLFTGKDISVWEERSVWRPVSQ